MTNEDHNIPSLLGSRICHDLISPLGAISNGLELLEMVSGEVSPEIELVRESAASASLRIRFFRIAFGASAPGQTVSRREVEDVLTGLSASGRHSFAWAPQETYPRDEAKLVFLTMLCLESALPSGGDILARQTEGQIEVTATGAKVRFDSDLWLGTKEGKDLEDVLPGTVHFALLRSELSHQNRTLVREQDDVKLTIRL